MAFNLGSISARLQLDTNGYTRGMLNAQSLNAVFGQSVTNFINNPLLGSVAALRSAGRTVISWSRQITEAAESVQRLGRQTGLSTNTIQALRAEFELAGRPITQADQAFRTFNTRLQQARELGGPVAETFNRIGVSIDGMRGTQDVLRDVLDQITQFGDVATSAALAAQLFGEEAGSAVAETVAAGGGLDEITRKMQQFGVVSTSEAVDRMAELNTRMGEFELALKGIKQQLTTDFLTAFTRDMDLTTEAIAKNAEQTRDALSSYAEGAGILAAAGVDVLEWWSRVSGEGVDFLFQTVGPEWQQGQLDMRQEAYERRMREREARGGIPMPHEEVIAGR